MEAANTGTATRKPACVGLRVSCLEMKGARGPNITQVVKPVSKYRKQATRAFQLPLFRESISCFMTTHPNKNAANITLALEHAGAGGVAFRGEVDATVVPMAPFRPRKLLAPTT